MVVVFLSPHKNDLHTGVMQAAFNEGETNEFSLVSFPGSLNNCGKATGGHQGGSVLTCGSTKGGQASRSAVVAEILAKHLGDYE